MTARKASNARESQAPSSDKSGNVSDVTCLGCGCLCDDLQVACGGDSAVNVVTDCSLGRQWFSSHWPIHLSSPAEHDAWIEGRSVTVSQAISAAATTVREARQPLIYGLVDSATDGQRAAIAIAQQVGAVVDTPLSQQCGPIHLGLQHVGQVTATLGEIRQRADLVVFWDCDPMTTHPRFVQRYCPLESGDLPHRRIMTIGASSATSKIAGQHISWSSEVLPLVWAVRGCLTDSPMRTPPADGLERDRYDVAGSIVRELLEAKYAAVFFATTDAETSMAFLRMIRDVNRTTRCVGATLGAAGNVTGSANVLAWSTGFPFAMRTVRGYPEFGPGELTASQLIQRREVDVAIVIGNLGTPSIRSTFNELTQQQIPVIHIGPLRPDQPVAVDIHADSPAVCSASTVYRNDGVPLPLRPTALESSSEVDVLRQLLAAMMA